MSKTSKTRELTDKQKMFIKSLSKEESFKRSDSIIFIDDYTETLESEGIMNKMAAGAMVSTLKKDPAVIEVVRVSDSIYSRKKIKLTDLGREIYGKLRKE